ncbi:helix-turn-helix domain-containing protein [Mucilaginibacter sp. SJ]|uniref:helix-turn-helix domain-containing protein n=1 Tax=Mucilaginibacter sp. SJ TaxID=3029053 RepID=UPI0023A979AF|nr:helix-turn-helix transcriptional regulator [Mucilaginibacter sp. SJ]WDZ99614.1 helix-turn-helix transcriptional regulator [Mucilaginibacter sp. SJ]
MKFDEISRDPEENFGERLKKLRLKNGLTQMQLAASLDMSNVQITRYEKNITKPTITIIKKLSKALAVRYEDLAGDMFDIADPTEEIENVVERLQRLPIQDKKAVLEVLSNYVQQKEIKMISSI